MDTAIDDIVNEIDGVQDSQLYFHKKTPNIFV